MSGAVPPPPTSTPHRSATWRDIGAIGAVFLRIGATAFGGPAAHIAIMRHELIARRQWIDEEHFLDLLGATNLIPGPNSSEMTMHIGYVRGGVRGLIAGGTAFLLPGMLITLALAWLYTTYGSSPAAEWLLYGIKPVIIPLIVLALWALSRKAVKGGLTAAVGLAAVALYAAGVNFVVLLLGGGIAVMVVQMVQRWDMLGTALLMGAAEQHPYGGWVKRLLDTAAGLGTAGAASTTAANVSLFTLFWVFFKIGALLYGSGYVLFAFLQAEVVERYGWLTEQQLIDAIAFGQMTPGPLSTTTTFIGYLLAGVPGALLGTAAFYLPGFVIVGLSHPLIPRIRHSAWASGLLDGVNVAALGLMAAVTWELARAAFVDAYTLLLGVVALGLLLRYKLNSAYLVLLGAGAGLLGVLW